MNELEQQLAELLKKGIAAAEKTGQFVIDQAPELLQQFYNWQIAKNASMALASIVLYIVLYKFLKSLGSADKPKVSEYSTDDYIKILGRYYNDFVGILITIFGFVGGAVVALMFIIPSVHNLLFIMIAPKIYLIQYFAR